MGVKLNTFIQQAAALGQRLGFTDIIIAARDPDTGEIKAVAGPGGVETLKPAVLQKLGIDPAQLGGGEEPFEAVWGSSG